MVAQQKVSRGEHAKLACTHAEGIKAYREGKKSFRCDKCRENHRKWSKKIREEVLRHYGGVCFCCGEVRLEFLCIDHIGGGGTAHRKQARYGSIYYWLRKHDFPAGYRVACHNCNLAMGFYGYCPHQQPQNEAKPSLGLEV